jgi:hypothetical protein
MAGVVQVNATRGELTPLLHARVDLEHYRGGMAQLRNFVSLRFGGFTRVPGTVYYGETKFADKFSRFIPFEFRRDQTYAIEAGDLYFRFWNVFGQVETAPDTPYEVTTPYEEADLPYLQVRQSGDVLYMTCDGYWPRTLTRNSETNWTIALHLTEDGPFLPINIETTTLTPSGTTGSITLTASAVDGINNGLGFRADDVNRVVRFLGSDGTWRWMRITAFTSTTEVTASIGGPTDLPDTDATAEWRLGAWSGYTGFPAAVGIFEDRLGMAGTLFEPLNAWYSVNADYDSHTVSNPLVDDDAVNVRMTGGKLNGIQWLSDGRDIVVGTEGSLRAIGRNDLAGAFSPTNVRQRTETTVPVSYIPPILIESMLLVLDIYRTKLMEVGYTQDVDGYVARELSALNEHLLGKGIRDYAYQASPHKILWMVTDEGTLLAATYDRDQEVFGVTECELGGDAYAEAVVTLPGTDKDGDQVWLTVRRTVDGSTVRYVEYLSAFYREGYTEQDYPIYAHSAGVYAGTSTNSVTGVDHLEGETVGIWSDGVDAGDAVVTGGEITFPEELAGEKIVFGLRYNSRAETLRLAVDNRDGGTLGKRVNLSGCILDLYQTYAISAGSLTTTDALRVEAEAEEDPYEPAVLRTGSYQINMDDSWLDNGVCVVETNSMHPATITAITVLAEFEP